MSSWAYSPSPSECHPQMDISGAKSDKTWELLSATNPSVNTADLKSDLDHLPLTVRRRGTRRQTVHQLLSQPGVSGGNGCWFCLSWLSELNSQSMVGPGVPKNTRTDVLGRTGTQRGEHWLFSFFNNPCYEPKKLVWTPTCSTNFPFCQTTVKTSVLPKLLRLCYGSWMNQRSKVLIGWGVRYIQMPSPCQWESQKWPE